MVLQEERYNTSLHKIMDHLDLEIKHLMQDWAEQPLPVNGKSALLTAVAAYQEKGKKKSPRTPASQPNDLISWAMVYCVDRRISLARIVT
jgi:hypothetical protein